MNKNFINYQKRRFTVKGRKWFKTISQTSDTPKSSNTLVIGAGYHGISETMIYPIYWYEKELNSNYGVRFSQISAKKLKEEYLKGKRFICHKQVKRIFFQAEFGDTDEQMSASLEYLRKVYPEARIAFMDWYAPLHIRPSIVVDGFIDFYIKKQTFRDFNQYSIPTEGDTNLSDYYSKRHDLKLEKEHFIPPENFESKLILWPTFGLSVQMVDFFLGELDIISPRPIDLHSRLTVKGTEWYKAMRQEAFDAVEGLNMPQLNIASKGFVKRYKFFKEMQQSKMCFSPFGYGEVCFRDYESFATGALLLKPNMDHLNVWPDIFVAGETYVSLEWDLSDLKEKVAEYQSNDYERKRIAQNAFDAMKQNIQSDEFVKLFSRLV